MKWYSLIEFHAKYTIKKKMENIIFIIIGGKTEEVSSRYRNITNKINNIIFRGFVNQELIVKYLSASDILLMPHTEQCDIIKYTSPMKMFEYMASKKPIISSNLPVIREMLNEKNGTFPVKFGTLFTLLYVLFRHEKYYF